MIVDKGVKVERRCRRTKMTSDPSPYISCVVLLNLFNSHYSISSNSIADFWITQHYPCTHPSTLDWAPLSWLLSNHLNCNFFFSLTIINYFATTSSVDRAIACKLNYIRLAMYICFITNEFTVTQSALGKSRSCPITCKS